MIVVSQKAASQRNVTFHIHGTVEYSDPVCYSIKLPQGNLKLTSLLWLIEEKMGFYLYKTEDEVWMPLESRNFLRFDQGIPINSDELWLRPFKTDQSGQRTFFMIMDFDK